MANTYTLIASTTLTGSQATVTFSNIPSTYTDLVIKWSARANSGATGPSPFPVKITFNSIGGTSYSQTVLNTELNVPGSSRVSNQAYLFIDKSMTASGGTANTFSNTELYIPSYTASQNKPFSSFAVGENNTTTNGEIFTSASLLSNTSTISSITLDSGIYNFAANSSFYLYGIKNS